MNKTIYEDEIYLKIKHILGDPNTFSTLTDEKKQYI
jgi:hypothetical protein